MIGASIREALSSNQSKTEANNDLVVGYMFLGLVSSHLFVKLNSDIIGICVFLTLHFYTWLKSVLKHVNCDSQVMPLSAGQSLKNRCKSVEPNRNSWKSKM